MGRTLSGSGFAALAALIALTVAGRAEASTCTVTTTVDVIPSQPGTLRACVEAANGSASSVDIGFDPSVFKTSAPGVIQLVDVLPSLTSDSPIVIDGASAAAVVIDGSQTVGVSGFDLVSGNHVLRNLTMEGFTAAGTGGYGDGTAVTLEDGSSGDTLENLVLHDNQGGAVFLLGNNVGTTIRGCEIHHNHAAGIRSSGGGAAPPCGPRIEITDNYFHDDFGDAQADDLMLPNIACVDVLRNRFEHNSYFGVRLASPETHDVVISQNTFLDAPVGFFGGAHDNLFAFNTVDSVPLGNAVAAGDRFDDGGPATVNNVFEGNIIRGSTVTGLQLYPGADGSRVYDNTFYGNGSYGLEAGALSDVRIQNNLFVGNSMGARTVSDAGNWVIDHNGYFANANGDCTEDCSVEPGAFFGDPGFAAPPDDLSLASCGSGAVDRGVDLGADQPDLTGPADAVSYNGAAPDLGALESACGAPGGTAGTTSAGSTSGSGATASSSGGATSGATQNDETPYAPQIGCGCASTPAGDGFWILALASAAVSRRCRRRRSPSAKVKRRTGRHWACGHSQ